MMMTMHIRPYTTIINYVKAKQYLVNLALWSSASRKGESPPEPSEPSTWIRYFIGTGTAKVLK